MTSISFSGLLIMLAFYGFVYFISLRENTPWALSLYSIDKEET